MSDQPLPEPPYPAETQANGWHPELHIERITASDTWTLAEDEERAWLLRIWLEAWRSVPVGSMPVDRRLFARRIGCSMRYLEDHAEILLRGWVQHADGKLYHRFIAEQVNAMLNKRLKSRQKVQAHRDRLKQRSQNVTVTNGYSPVSNRQEQEQEQEQESSSTATQYLSSAEADDRAAQVKADACPHLEIIQLYLERLPELPRVIPSRWSGSKSERHLRMRWREDARHQSLDFWRRFFDAVRTNPHWMGSNDRGWTADLHWLLKRENFDKVIHRLAAHKG